MIDTYMYNLDIKRIISILERIIRAKQKAKYLQNLKATMAFSLNSYDTGLNITVKKQQKAVP